MLWKVFSIIMVMYNGYMAQQFFSDGEPVFGSIMVALLLLWAFIGVREFRK